jgi:low affinity Fe/Cu permease
VSCHHHSPVVVGFSPFGVLVFALTMAGAHVTVDAQLQEVRGQVDGLAADIRTMHERLDSTVTSTTARFNQLDLAETATRTTLDTILARLDALTTRMEQDYGSYTEQEDADRCGSSSA